MRFYLIAMNGKERGTCWPIPEEGILIGRDPAAALRLFDPEVSRHQCILRADADVIHYENLAKSNPALVKGAVCETAALHTGDEIAIGQWRFLIGAHNDDPAADDSPFDHTPTRALELSEPLALNARDAKPAARVAPRTVSDLAALYNAARDFGACNTRSAFLNVFARELAERFAPARMWLALARGEDEWTLLDLEGKGDPAAGAPEKLLRDAMSRSQGLLSVAPRDKSHWSSLMAAPLLAGDTCVAAVALEKPGAKPEYDEEHLRMLVLLAQAAAPSAVVVESLDQLRRDNQRLRAAGGPSLTFVGESPAMKSVDALLERAARAGMNVLITGETGAGKEIAARQIHERSSRQGQPFVILNCAAIPSELFEGQLFGHEKGSFTGAERRSMGLWSEAHGGTLFLDEIGDLGLEHQARILRTIELGTFYRVGATQETHVDTLVVAATNKDLLEAVKEGRFRRDLYHRLAAFEIALPPLREHLEDVPALARHFLDIERHEAKFPVSGFSDAALAWLEEQTWPGNVRELRNCILRAIRLAQQPMIDVTDLIQAAPMRRAAAAAAAPSGKVQTLEEAERQLIEDAINTANGNAVQAAKLLGIARSTLYNKMQRYGLAG